MAEEETREVAFLAPELRPKPFDPTWLSFSLVWVPTVLIFLAFWTKTYIPWIVIVALGWTWASIVLLLAFSVVFMACVVLSKILKVESPEGKALDFKLVEYLSLLILVVAGSTSALSMGWKWTAFFYPLSILLVMVLTRISK